ADAEALDANDEDMAEQIQRLAERTGMKASDVYRQLERADQLQAVRSDVKKSKALEWLVEHAEIVDDEGHPIDRADLEAAAETEDDTAGEDVETGDTTDSSSE